MSNHYTCETLGSFCEKIKFIRNNSLKIGLKNCYYYIWLSLYSTNQAGNFVRLFDPPIFLSMFV